MRAAKLTAARMSEQRGPLWKASKIMVSATIRAVSAEMVGFDRQNARAIRAHEMAGFLRGVGGAVASITGDGAYDQDGVSTAVAERHPVAAAIMARRPTGVPSQTAETEPTQRDRHRQFTAGHGRAAWRKALGSTTRAQIEATIGRFRQVIGDGLRSRTDPRRGTEVVVAVDVLNRMLELGRPISVGIA
jgi:hypothetical protein